MKQEFQLPAHAIETEASILITASPEKVASVYRDVEKWGDTFPATIEHARVIQTGKNWKQIEVAHKQEGCVPNTLFDLSETEIALKESKSKYNATFLNQFEPAPNGGTRYIIHGYINLKGIYKVLKPFLTGYVRRQSLKSMQTYVLDPLKNAAEKKALR